MTLPLTVRIGIAVVIAATAIERSAAQTDVSKIAPDVLTKEQRADARGMIDRDIQQRIKAFNAQHREEWSKVATREQWEKYKGDRIEKLRQSLAVWPAPKKPNVKTIGTIKGDGFQIENIAYESRPGFLGDGQPLRPRRAAEVDAGILIAHAHHGGKRDSELQDMGMTWARAGCVVLVIDQVGYGERRSHPFHKATDYDKPFKTGRQDYFFRYDTGVQLQLLGDSLMGWMAWDLMRGVDVLLAREGVDAKRIALLGAVAGGGDPAGVTAALDPRIACVVPFNFGGPQPETKHPLPEDAETSFNYLLFTYWDSTRGLRLGAKDDFPHWVITASVAPRYLIHGHEFSWDKERDPVWKRYQKVWGDFYKMPDNVGVAHGKGLLSGRPPEASHCNNIGEFHRRMIHPLFEKWLGIQATEYRSPRPGDELVCLTEDAKKNLKPKSLNTVMSETADARVAQARQRLAGKTAEERRTILRDEWAKLLGPIEPAKTKAPEIRSELVGNTTVERFVLEVEPGILVPVAALVPQKRAKQASVVIGLAQAGRAGFLKERSDDINKLLDAGVMVVLPDLRGAGETQVGASRGKDSSGTNHSTHVQLFGETLLGQRLRDLRSVIGYLRTRPDVDGKRLVLWGDSFAPTNTDKTNFQIPHGVDGAPAISEPLGGLLALLGALYEDDIRAVSIAGGLASYQPVLSHFAVLIPHDASVPGALKAGDLCDLAGGLAPRPLSIVGMVDAMNRPVADAELRKQYSPTVDGYAARPQSLAIGGRTTAAAWILEQMK